MDNKPKVLLVATLDSKEIETRFIRERLEENGLEVYLLDASIRRTVAGGADITPDQIAAAVGTTMPEIRALNHEGKCMALMIQGAIKRAHELDEQVGFSGIIAAGGSGGTTLGAAIMRTFPFGLPKVLISTMASGMTKPFVGTKDIMMLNSICDVAGLNTVTRRVFENGALALAGMAKGYRPLEVSGKPVVTMTTLSVTDACCNRVRAALEQAGSEVMVFHSQGTGGPAMDETVREQDVSLVIDLSLIEVGDYLAHGLYDGGPDRCKAALEKGVPVIFVPGNIDFLVDGPVEGAKLRFPGRRYHIHNASVTAVRADANDFKHVAEHMAGLIREARGPVAFFVPLLGFSSHDSEQGHLHDPSLPPVFAEHLQKVMPEEVPVVVLPYHINDPQFADALIEQAWVFLGGAVPSTSHIGGKPRAND
jgi:uncharacterized protein (UPF0261 family)